MKNVKRVRAYPFKTMGKTTVSYVQRFEFAKDAEVLFLSFTGEKLCLWVLEEDGKEKIERSFLVITTVYPIDHEEFTYIGSASVDLFGAKIMHVFEVWE